MVLKKLDYDLAVCQLKEDTKFDLNKTFFALIKTDEELSLVCLEQDIPNETVKIDKGWKAFYIKGVLDFSLVGIVAKISNILAENKISIFAMSTYNTDYILVKKENFEKALNILKNVAYTVE